MLTRLFIVAAVCFAFAHGVANDPYSRRYGVCKDSMNTLLTVPSGSTRCTLVQGLYTLTTKAALTSAQNATFTAWVNTLESSIINNAAVPTAEGKFNLIAAAFEKFSFDQTVIYKQVQYLNISTWGPFETVTRVTTEWNMQSSLELIVASSAHGNCKLFDLLLSACAGDSAKQSALSAFIDSDLKAIVSSTTMSQTEVITAIYQAFQTKFFVTNPSWVSYFYSLNLNGYFAFSQWSDVAVTYQRQTTITTTLSGSGMDCPFILAMNATLATTGQYSNTQKAFIKNLMNFFIQQWTTVTTVEARLTLISMKFSESIDLSYSYFACLNSIQIQGFGSWWDLIIYSCQKTTIPPSCGCVVPTFAPDTTTAAPMPTTTEAIEVSTTEAIETTAEASTTEFPTEFSTEGTTEMITEFSTDATSDFTWDSSSPITFPSTDGGCSCTCEY